MILKFDMFLEKSKKKLSKRTKREMKDIFGDGFLCVLLLETAFHVSSLPAFVSRCQKMLIYQFLIIKFQRDTRFYWWFKWVIKAVKSIRVIVRWQLPVSIAKKKTQKSHNWRPSVGISTADEFRQPRRTRRWEIWTMGRLEHNKKSHSKEDDLNEKASRNALGCKLITFNVPSIALFSSERRKDELWDMS